MLPVDFVELPTLPKTSSGKIDRVLLTETQLERGQNVA